MKNLIVGQSGGPTAVINSSLYGVVAAARVARDGGAVSVSADNAAASEARDSSEVQIDKIYGMENGIEGFLKGTFLDFDEVLPGEQLELLKNTPGAYLGSCRYMLPDSLGDEVYQRLFAKFEELNIGYFMYCGGNDSMDTVSKISRYAERVGSDVRVLGVPKTIDNDLVMTDHTPGFGSAAKYVATTVREIVTDASVYEVPAVTIIEIMGRHAGWLTAASALARRFEGDAPYLIYLPETDFDVDDFVERVDVLLKQHNAVVVCVSEGINDAQGKFICEYDNSTGVDSFGHKMLAGAGKFLENLLRDKLGCKARSVEFNVSQRCSAALASKTDRDEAIMAGRLGVESALKGETGKMIAFDRVEGDSLDANGAGTADVVGAAGGPGDADSAEAGDAESANATEYKITCSLQDVNKICNEEKKVPASMISTDGTDVTDEFIRYASPLIKGDIEVPKDNDGLPKFVYRKDKI